MLKVVWKLALVTALSMTSLVNAKAMSVEEISVYGVYVKGADGFVAAAPVKNMNSLNYDFSKRLLGLPPVILGDQPLEVIIYNKDINPNYIEVEVRSMSAPGGNGAISVDSITPLGDDKFLLKYEKISDKNSFLLVDLYCCTNNIFGIAFTDSKAAVLNIFGKGTEHNPTSAEYVVSQILQGAPEDSELKALQSYWLAGIKQKEATNAYDFITTLWTKYESTKTPEDKVNALSNVRSLCENYIEEYPIGNELKDVNRMLKIAKEKLDI